MSIDPSNEHGILLNETEPRSCLSRASNNPFVTIPSSFIQDLLRPDNTRDNQHSTGIFGGKGNGLGGYTTASGQHIQCNPLAEEKVSCFPLDGRNVLDRFKRLSFFHVPFHAV